MTKRPKWQEPFAGLKVNLTSIIILIYDMLNTLVRSKAQSSVWDYVLMDGPVTLHLLKNIAYIILSSEYYIYAKIYRDFSPPYCAKITKKQTKPISDLHYH